MEDDRAYWVAWSHIAGVGAILLRRLHLHFGSLAAAWFAPAENLQAIEGVGWQTAESIGAARSALDPHNLLQQHEQENPCFWTPADAGYPRLLLEMADPPPILYYRGTVDLIENQGQTPCIAIVGTRSPSEYGKRWTRRITTALIEAGYTIVSGLADGIDTIAHHACLEAGGRTIAVMGTGVDVVYPWRNKELACRVIEHGLLLSEYPAGTQPDRVHFPRRNRIIAGLCRATLVLEAPQKSGALITARLANEYGRDVYVLPNSLDNSRARGCLELLNQGAALILGETELLENLASLPQLVSSCAAVDRAAVYQNPKNQDSRNQISNLTSQLSLLSNSSIDSPLDESALPRRPPDEVNHSEPLKGLATDLQQVFSAVSAEPVLVDRIVQETGLLPGQVLSALTQLELMGLVTLAGGARYSRL